MIWIKRLFVLILLSILVYLFLPVARELHHLGGVIQEASWAWLLAAVAIQFTSYASLTLLNTMLLRPFPGKIGFWRMIAVLPAIAFIEVTVPSMGASGVVLRARLLGKSGYSAEASTFTALMETVFIGVMMLTVSLLGLWYMLRMGEIRRFQIVLLELIAGVLVLAGIGIIWFGRDRQRVIRVSLRLNGITNRWRARAQRQPIDDDAIIRRVEDFFQGLAQMRKLPIWPYWLPAFFRVSLDIATLGACFIAFHYSIPAGVLVTGYGLMLLVSGLASIPGGLGITEISLSVIYARLGAPGAVAVAAALTYRLIAWWLVRFVGFISWQILEVRGAKSKSSSTTF